MSKFLSSLILKDETGESMELYMPLVYRSDKLGREIVVPAGFETDFASIPRFFHRLIPKNGLYDKAAVIHDYLYSTGVVAKQDADLVFFEAMLVLGVPSWKRNVMYLAVHWFGWMAWNNHRRNRK